MTSPRDHGSLGEEATRLVEALQGWLSGAYRGDAAGDDTWARATADPGGGIGQSPECAVCPLCRSMRFVRTVRPETVEHLVDTATALVAALHELRRPPSSTRSPTPRPPADADAWD